MSKLNVDLSAIKQSAANSNNLLTMQPTANRQYAHSNLQTINNSLANVPRRTINDVVKGITESKPGGTILMLNSKVRVSFHSNHFPYSLRN